MKSITLTIVGALLVCVVSFGITNSQAEETAYDANGQFLGVLLGQQSTKEYVEVDLYPYYTEDYNLFDNEYRGFFDYFDQDHITIPDLPEATFYVKSKNHPGPHVLSSTLEGTESIRIPIGKSGITRIFILGTGTYLASPFGHSVLWCEDKNHFSFTLTYSDGIDEEVFPVNKLTRLPHWSDILHGYKYGFDDVAVGHFPASDWGHFHLYEITIDDLRTLTSITMNDKAGGIPGLHNVGDYTIMAMTLEVTSIPVELDIKPGSRRNPVNQKSKGVLPVAILGTEGLDVTTIDPESIVLSREGIEGGVSPISWNLEDVGTPFEGELCESHDLNGDGYMDLTLKFKTPEVVETLVLGDVTGETLPLTITGNLTEEVNGTPIKGEDCVRVLDVNNK